MFHFNDEQYQGLNIVYQLINDSIDQVLYCITEKHVPGYNYLIQNIDKVAESDYQERYKKYWRLYGAGLSQDYCTAYFQHLEAGLKGTLPKIDVLTNQLYKIPTSPNKLTLQFSFCSKLCHMLNRHLPIYDSQIKNFYGLFKRPSSRLPIEQRIEAYVGFYEFLSNEYTRVLTEGVLSPSIKLFRQEFDSQYFTNEKVVDSLIFAYMRYEKIQDGKTT